MVTGEGVFVVPAEEATAVRTSVFDLLLHVADIPFSGVRVTDDNRGTADPEQARHIALAGLALTMVGACRRILDLVIEHVRTRRQFDALIGSFQAVQHKAVDMHWRSSGPVPSRTSR